MGNKTVLIVAAHADDEVLGCGGTIAKHTSEGDVVHAVFMADGVRSRSNTADVDLPRRMVAAKQAHKILGLQRVEFLELPDNCMDSVPLLKIVQALEAVIQKISPQVIYTHHHGDLNIDHRITHNAVMTACRPVPGCAIKEIYSFEVLSSTEWAVPSLEPFLPNCFVDIKNFLDHKIKALQAYELEMRPVPHSRSIEHVKCLARHRGYSVGVDAAEAFMSIRQIR
jgi:LmbE family N-acetylglucosaminyl deacetylase